MIDCVDGDEALRQSGVGRLAHAVADNPMRKTLRSRLHTSDDGVARRRCDAQRSGIQVTEADVAARALVLAEADPHAMAPAERRAVWPAGCGARVGGELRDLTQHHGPERAPAKKLLESVDQGRAASGGDRAPDAARSAAVERSPGSPTGTLGRRPLCNEEDPRRAVVGRLLDDLARLEAGILEEPSPHGSTEQPSVVTIVSDFDLAVGIAQQEDVVSGHVIAISDRPPERTRRSPVGPSTPPWSVSGSNVSVV